MRVKCDSGKMFNMKELPKGDQPLWIEMCFFSISCTCLMLVMHLLWVGICWCCFCAACRLRGESRADVTTLLELRNGSLPFES